MSADNPNGPATEGAIDYKSMYEQEQKKHSDLRRAYNQRDQEIRAAREAAQSRNRPDPLDYQEEEAAPAPTSRYGEEDLEDIRFRLARNEFLALNGDGKDYWDRINQVILDESRVAPFAVWDRKGRPNYEATIRSIYRDMRLSEMEAAKAKAAATAPPPAPARPNLAPVISGGAASAETSFPHPDDMSMEDLFGAAQQLADPNDPISGGATGNKPSTSLR